MNFQEIREKSWSGGNGSALRAVKLKEEYDKSWHKRPHGPLGRSLARKSRVVQYIEGGLHMDFENVAFSEGNHLLEICSYCKGLKRSTSQVITS